MTVPPYAVAYVVTVVVAWSADHFNRFVPFIIPSIINQLVVAIKLTIPVAVSIPPFSPLLAQWAFWPRLFFLQKHTL